MRVAPLLLVLLAAGAVPAAAQGLDGYVSVLFDALPGVDARSGQPAESRRSFSELRARLFAERRFVVGERLRLNTAGFVEGLAADRGAAGGVETAIVRPQELNAELLWPHADLRVGFSRVVWGRLDEFLPTDVVNPIDLTRFFFEGRSEARLPVAMVRGRLLPSDRFTLEGIYVPVFRRGRFDQLDEETAPFNVAPLVPLVPREPARTWSNAQGGARMAVTTGRVDWAISAFRGFEALPVYVATAPLINPMATVEERFPRFTMLGADFETVRGEWGLRGEVAAFVERTLQAADRPDAVRGRTVEGGVGADRRAGDYRVSANVLVTHRTSSDLDDTDAMVVASLDRSFARETRQVRAFAVYNPGDDSAFVRVIGSLSLRDDVTFEASAGVFAGDGADALSRLATRDFVYARLKVFF